MPHPTSFSSHSAASTDGTQIAYRTGGSPTGRPLVLLHGWTQSSLAWGDDVLGSLGEHFRIIAVDLRGHGNSDKAASGYDSSQQWADDIEAVLDDAGVTGSAGAILLGWSYGGIVVGDYLALKGAERLDAIALVCATTSVSRAPGGAVGQAMLKAAKGAIDEDPKRAIAALASFGNDMFANPAGEAQQRLFGLSLVTPPHVRGAMLARRVNNDETFAALEIPALVIHGTADGVVLPSAGEANAETIPNSTLKLYEGVAHAPFAEESERFVADLVEFAHLL